MLELLDSRNLHNDGSGVGLLLLRFSNSLVACRRTTSIQLRVNGHSEVEIPANPTATRKYTERSKACHVNRACRCDGTIFVSYAIKMLHVAPHKNWQDKVRNRSSKCPRLCARTKCAPLLVWIPMVCRLLKQKYLSTETHLLTNPPFAFYHARRLWNQPISSPSFSFRDNGSVGVFQYQLVE